MAKTVKINGRDYTDFFTPVGQRVGYNKIRGQNTGYMLDGSYTDDVLATKAVLHLTCMPLSESRMTQITTEVEASDYLSVYYYDPRQGRHITATMMLSDITQRFVGKGSDGNFYWSGLELELTER